MPKRKRSKSTKRSYKKARVYKTPSPYTVMRSINGIPTGQRTTMKYVTRINMGSGATNFTQYVFRAFSIFDPDQTGVGHQPMGHDQWAAFYRRYRVLGSKISVVATNNYEPAAGGVHFPVRLVVMIASTGTGMATSDQSSEMPISNHTLMSGASGSIGRVSLPYISAVKAQGTIAAKTENDYAAFFGQNPVRDNYYHITCEQGGAGTIDAQAIVEIVFDVWMDEPVDLLES